MTSMILKTQALHDPMFPVMETILSLVETVTASFLEARCILTFVLSEIVFMVEPPLSVERQEDAHRHGEN